MFFHLQSCKFNSVKILNTFVKSSIRSLWGSNLTLQCLCCMSHNANLKLVNYRNILCIKRTMDCMVSVISSITNQPFKDGTIRITTVPFKSFVWSKKNSKSIFLILNTIFLKLCNSRQQWLAQCNILLQENIKKLNT